MITSEQRVIAEVKLALLGCEESIAAYGKGRQGVKKKVGELLERYPQAVKKLREGAGLVGKAKSLRLQAEEFEAKVKQFQEGQQFSIRQKAAYEAKASRIKVMEKGLQEVKKYAGDMLRSIAELKAGKELMALRYFSMGELCHYRNPWIERLVKWRFREMAESTISTFQKELILQLKQAGRNALFTLQKISYLSDKGRRGRPQKQLSIREEVKSRVILLYKPTTNPLSSVLETVKLDFSRLKELKTVVDELSIRHEIINDYRKVWSSSVGQISKKPIEGLEQLMALGLGTAMANDQAVRQLGGNSSLTDFCLEHVLAQINSKFQEYTDSVRDVEQLVKAKSLSLCLIIGLKVLNQQQLATSVENMLVQSLPRFGRMVLNPMMQQCRTAIQDDNLQKVISPEPLQMFRQSGIENPVLIKSTVRVAQLSLQYLVELIRFSQVARLPTPELYSCVRLFYKEVTVLYIDFTKKVTSSQALTFYLNHSYLTKYVGFLVSQLPQVGTDDLSALPGFRQEAEKLKGQAFQSVLKDAEQKVQVCMEPYFETVSWSTKKERQPSEYLHQLTELTSFMHHEYLSLNEEAASLLPYLVFKRINDLIWTSLMGQANVTPIAMVNLAKDIHALRQDMKLYSDPGIEKCFAQFDQLLAFLEKNPEAKKFDKGAEFPLLEAACVNRLLRAMQGSGAKNLNTNKDTLAKYKK